MSINIEISIGEFWDKITILQIKADRIKDKNKLINITKELNQLVNHWKKSSHNEIEIDAELKNHAILMNNYGISKTISVIKSWHKNLMMSLLNWHDPSIL